MVMQSCAFADKFWLPDVYLVTGCVATGHLVWFRETLLPWSFGEGWPFSKPLSNVILIEWILAQQPVDLWCTGFAGCSYHLEA